MAPEEKKIGDHLQIALKEVGQIKPWYDPEVSCWVFEHPNYPVTCGEETAAEVIAKYPLYLKEFIHYRLMDRLDPFVEAETKGKAGKRLDTSQKTPSRSLRLPEPIADVAVWLRHHPEAIPAVHRLMKKYA